MSRSLISLGRRCDTAFQLRMHGDENVAHFFDWLATPIEGLITIIERDFDVFKPEHLTLRLDHRPHCVSDVMTGVTFHHQFPLYAGHVQPDFLLHYPAFKKKFAYLADRFRTYMATRPVTLVRRFIDVENALRLEQAVARTFPDADVRFLYLLGAGPDFVTPRGRARVIGTDDSSFGNPSHWVPILLEEGLIERPYRRATVDVLGTAHDDYNMGIEHRFNGEQLAVASAANPENGAFPAELAQWHILQSQWREALTAAEAALACDPATWGAAFFAALAAWKLGELDADEAANRLLEQARLPNAPPRWAIDVAAALRLAERIPEALDCINQAIQKDPVDARLYREKAEYLRDPRQAKEMVLVLRTAKRLDSRMSHMHEHYLANALEALGELEEAVEAAERSASGPPIFSFLWTYAGLLLKLGRFQEALEVLERARAVAGASRQQHVERMIQDTESRVAFATAAL